MAWFQLDPQSLAGRVRTAAGPTRPPTLAASVLRGVAGFTLMSVAGFAPWAFFARWFYRRVGEAALYASCAAVFIGLSGLLLHRLMIGPGSMRRFYKLFAFAFAAYAIVWTVCWMWLGADSGSIAGLLGGTGVMGAMLAFAFDAQRQVLKIIAALFVLSSLGYYAGEWIYWELAPWHPLAAMLLWGVFYGIGFGAGLGLAFYLCQSSARALIAPEG
ncbi:MAG: hypothetical protein M3463_07100 [Verrucomicrobiota bacterium]|nr:hypothetical protein [Verrucomicrobiota bacterium]